MPRPRPQSAAARPAQASSSKRERLLPREHGAYALVIAPLLTAFCRETPSWTGAALALATLAAFVLHEPVLILLSQRGPRARRELGALATRAVWVRGSVLALSGGYGLYSANAETRIGLAGVALLGLLVLALAIKAREKSGLGTLILAWSSALAAVPVALANGWSPADALLTAVVFAVTGAASMFTVRELIPKRRREDSLAAYVGGMSAVVALVAMLAGALRNELPVYFTWALVPTLVVAAVVLRLHPHPRHLKTVGWSLIAAKVCTFAVLAFA